MHSAVLVAALATPLVAALVALLLPSGVSGSRRAGSRGKTKAEKGSRKGRGRSLLGRRGGRGGGDGTDGSGYGGAVVEETIDERPPLLEAPIATEPSTPPDPQAVERAGRARQGVVRVAALATAGLWLTLVFLGPATAGAARAAGAVAPAAAGAALLLAAGGGSARRLPAAAGPLALGLASGGLALGTVDHRAGWVVAGLAGACIVLALAGRAGRDQPLGPLALALAGAAAVTGGLARVVATTGDLSLFPPADGRLALDAGLLLLGGSATLSVAAALHPRRSAALLLPIALAIGVPTAAALGAAGDAVALTLMLLALAGTVGWAATTTQFPDARPLSAALALAALAAAAVPTAGIPGTGAAVEGIVAAGVPAAWLLASAAVITAVALVPLAALCAVPGLAALTVVLVADPEPARLALVALVAAAVLAAAAALRRLRLGSGDAAGDAKNLTAAPAGVHAFLLGPLLAAVPALALGAWLLVAPATWTWVGPIRLDGWSESVAIAAAGGLIAAVAAGAAGRVAVPHLPLLPLLVAPDPVMAADPGASGRLVLVAGVALGLALVALVASV